MTAVFPPPLQRGDQIRVIAPSASLSFVEGGDTGAYLKNLAFQRFEDLGMTVTFGEHSRESDEFHSSSIKSRVADIHEAFCDPAVSGIMTAIGGFNSNELLPHLDFDLIANNPKFFCGYSDISVLQNAMLAKANLVTYSGPHWSTFGMRKHSELTRHCFEQAAFTTNTIQWTPSTWFTDDQWFLHQDDRSAIPTDGWWSINHGEATGTAVGSNISSLSLLKGTEFMPDLHNSVLFVEETAAYDITEFRRSLVSLLQQRGGETIHGVVIGRFQQASNVSKESLTAAIKAIPQLTDVPVVGNVDFGHTNPQLTFPIGGTAIINVGEETTIAFSR